eukprot:g33704.t1
MNTRCLSFCCSYALNLTHKPVQPPSPKRHPQDLQPHVPEVDCKDLPCVARCLTPTPRLACQVVVDEGHQEVSLPAMTLNFCVDGPVPTD